MREQAKITSINDATRDEGTTAIPKMCNALSGVWGWTQTALIKTEGGQDVFVRNVFWRVSPEGVSLDLAVPEAGSWKVRLPFALPTSGGERPSTIVHTGGVAFKVDGGWTAPLSEKIGRGADDISLGALSAGDRVFVKLSFSYMEG